MTNYNNIIKIYTEYIELAAFLKFAGLCETGGEAKILIKSGNVLLNGEICVQRGRKLKKGDEVSFVDERQKYTVG